MRRFKDHEGVERMKKTSRYWTGVLAGLIIPIYALILFILTSSKNENVTAIAVIGGFFVLPGIISTITWSMNFYTQVTQNKVDIHHYKVPLALMALNFLIFVALLLSLFIF